MLLSDNQIRQLCKERGMILPFSEEALRPGVVSYGVSSYGYDIRVGSTFKVFDSPINMMGHKIDPKKRDWHEALTTYENADQITIPPNSFALAETVERFNIPRQLLVICLGKSTYARCGIIVNVTPLEPEWQGRLTLEISNTTPLPAIIHANEGIAQILFFQGAEECQKSYADKKGKYQDQTGLVLPQVL